MSAAQRQTSHQAVNSQLAAVLRQHNDELVLPGVEEVNQLSSLV